ncbi:MAG: peptide chain release factor 2 [Deltaproteobacteria bacterium]
MPVDEVREQIKSLSGRLQELRGRLDVDGKRARVKVIEAESASPGFWDQNQKAQGLLKEKSLLEQTLTRFDAQLRALEDAGILLDLADEAHDDASRAEAAQSVAAAAKAVEAIELSKMLSGPNDRAAAIVTINAGAGGTESCDWAAMLLRMLSRYAERKGYEVELVDFQPGDEAGVKSADFLARGENAYGYLKAEAGVHRLVRISPFDAAARRHTSFASVFVTPEIEDDIEIEVKEADLRIDVFRASGAGGQKVNKTSSAVRLTHFPSGLVVSCQNERSQGRNKDLAMKILKSRLYDLEQKKRDAERDAVEAQKKEIGFGSQIRSYVLAPYRMVKDHRTGVEKGNVDAVLDGEVDEFVTAWLKGVRNPNRPTD